MEYFLRKFVTNKLKNRSSGHTAHILSLFISLSSLSLRPIFRKVCSSARFCFSTFPMMMMTTITMIQIQSPFDIHLGASASSIPSYFLDKYSRGQTDILCPSLINLMDPHSAKDKVLFISQVNFKANPVKLSCHLLCTTTWASNSVRLIEKRVRLPLCHLLLLENYSLCATICSSNGQVVQNSFLFLKIRGKARSQFLQ